jgi:CSLREA domain-containing protein
MNSRLTRLALSTTLGLAAAGLWLFLLAPSPALGAPGGMTASGATGQAPATSGLVFTATSAADIPDATPGDGVCETATGNGICTLRAAVQEASAHPGPDTIVLLPNTTYQLTRPAQGNSALYGQMDTTDSLGGDLDITGSVTLLGAGPASTIIDGNGAVTGDRVFQITGTVVISGVTIEHGRAQNEGGGLLNYFRLTLINSVVYSNTAININDWGGGIDNSGPLTITHSSVLSNATGNSNAYGGGMYNQGPLLITDSTFAGNSTFAGAGSPGFGGGLFNIGYTSTVVNSTFSGNTAAAGGGIYKGGYPLIVINSTLSGNHSTGGGGGLYAAYGATGLFNVTITQNQANSDNAGGGEGGGVAKDPGSTLTFANSIIAQNSKLITQHPFPELVLDDCYGAIISQGFSLVQNVDPGYCTVSGAYQPSDPLLGPLADNGGPTLTEALLPGSPAINGGNPSGCTDNVGALILTDQRGRARPAPGQGLCDIGAFEFPRLLFLPLVRR